jgi:hypothetical protein
MFRRSVLALTAVSMFSLPALAVTPYYLVKNDTTNKCEVTDKKPDGKMMMAVGKTASYKTKKAAEAAMKTAAECK